MNVRDIVVNSTFDGFTLGMMVPTFVFHDIYYMWFVIMLIGLKVIGVTIYEKETCEFQQN